MRSNYAHAMSIIPFHHKDAIGRNKKQRLEMRIYNKNRGNKPNLERKYWQIFKKRY